MMDEEVKEDDGWGGEEVREWEGVRGSEMMMRRWGSVLMDEEVREWVDGRGGEYHSRVSVERHSTIYAFIVSRIQSTSGPSSVNCRYKDEIPKYLHNKPKAVILHCLDRKASSACFCSDDITDIDATKGIFQVNSTNAHQYTVNFIIHLYSCPDWTQHHYPCKHFFAVFRLRP